MNHKVQIIENKTKFVKTTFLNRQVQIILLGIDGDVLANSLKIMYQQLKNLRSAS
jgi:hypothetical protein